MVSPMRKWRVGAFMLDCGKSVVRVILEVGVEMACEELVMTRSRYHGQSRDARRELMREVKGGGCWHRLAVNLVSSVRACYEGLTLTWPPPGQQRGMVITQ